MREKYLLILPGLIACESLGAAVVCALNGKWMLAGYWTSAALLNLSVIGLTKYSTM